MKTILISIRPEYCEKIFSGEKTIEVRKTAPEPPFKAIVYETKGREFSFGVKVDTVARHADSRFLDCRRGAPEIKTRICKGKEMPFISYGTMKVIGEFICNEVDNIFPFGLDAAIIDSKGNLFDPKPLLREICLTKKQVEKYLGKKGMGYGYHITAPKLYDKPKELMLFDKPCKYEYEPNASCYPQRCDSCCVTTITRPPQSWMYIQDPEEV